MNKITFAVLVLASLVTLPTACSDGGSSGGATPVDGGATPEPTTPTAPSKPAQRAANTTGTGSYSGNVAGFSLNAVDAMAYFEAGKPFPEPDAKAPFRGELNVRISDRAGTCADHAARIERMGNHYLEIEIDTYGATAEEATPKAGTYEITASNDKPLTTTRLRLVAFDDRCRSVDDPKLADRSPTVKRVVFTEVTPTHVAGSYEITNAGGSSISGTFESDICTLRDQDDAERTCK